MQADQALAAATAEELAQLEIALAARRQGGVVVVGGMPFIHGHPAIAGSTPLLECFSSWQCPHCRSPLSSQGFICLNGCHLTQPAFQRMQASLAESQAVVERGERLLNTLIARSTITTGGPFAVDTFPKDFRHYRSLVHVDIDRSLIPDNLEPVARWMRSQQLKSCHGIGSGQRQARDGSWENVYYGLFSHPDDAMMFKLAFGGK